MMVVLLLLFLFFSVLLTGFKGLNVEPKRNICNSRESVQRGKIIFAVRLYYGSKYPSVTLQELQTHALCPLAATCTYDF